MTYDQLEQRIREILPSAEFGEDNYGQIIVYTGLVEKPDTDELADFEDEDENA